MSKSFKVGDMVRRTGVTKDHMPHGSVHEVFHVNKDGSKMNLGTPGSENGNCSWFAENFELLESGTPTTWLEHQLLATMEEREEIVREREKAEDDLLLADTKLEMLDGTIKVIEGMVEREGMAK